MWNRGRFQIGCPFDHVQIFPSFDAELIEVHHKNQMLIEMAGKQV